MIVRLRSRDGLERIEVTDAGTLQVRCTPPHSMLQDWRGTLTGCMVGKHLHLGASSTS